MAQKSATTKALEKKVSSYGTAYTKGWTSLLAKQEAKAEAQFGKYEAKVAGQEKMGDAFTRLGAEAGLPEIGQQIGAFKGEIYKIKDLIDRLDEDITARTTGSFTTEAQRRRQVAAEEEPLQRTMGRLGTGMAPLIEQQTETQSLIATQLGLISADQQKELQPMIMRIEALSDRFSREITGYTKSKESELTLLLDKLSSQRALDKAEWDRVQQIAKEERDFVKQKQLIAIQQANKAKSGGGGTKATQTSELRTSLSALSSKYKNMSWDKMSKELKGQGVDPVFLRDWVYQQAVTDYPKVSESSIKNLVYNTYFPDQWR